MPRPKTYGICAGCGIKYPKPNKRSTYHSRRCYLDSTKEKRKHANRAIFNDERAMEREEAFRAIDQKFEDKYGKGSF